MAKRSNKWMPWTEWKVSCVIRSKDSLISDEGVAKYVQYRLGMRSKDTDYVSIHNLSVTRRKRVNQQEVLL